MNRQEQDQEAFELRATYSLDEIRRTHLFQFWRRLWWVYVLFALVIVFAAASAPVTNLQRRMENAIGYFELLVIYTMLFAAVPYVGGGRKFHQLSYLREPIAFVFGREGISFCGVGISSTMLWSILIKVRETKSLYLLYFGSAHTVIVPKRFFQGPEETERWLRLLASRVDSSLMEKPGFAGRWF